jgi:hypothetical protein
VLTDPERKLQELLLVVREFTTVTHAERDGRLAL